MSVEKIEDQKMDHTISAWIVYALIGRQLHFKRSELRTRQPRQQQENT